MIRRIRPHQVFHMVEPDRRESRMLLPRAGALPAVEAALLIALLKAVRPRRVFEFGTYRGDTTWMLAANLDDPEGTVHTLDLPELEGVAWTGVDRQVAEQGRSEPPAFAGTPLEPRIVRLLEDSMRFDATPHRGRFQYVFVDANHHEDYVRRDTENALAMLDRTRPSCLIWHDYGNEHHPGLTRYLDALAEGLPIAQVEETSVALLLSGIDVSERSSPASWAP